MSELCCTRNLRHIKHLDSFLLISHYTLKHVSLDDIMGLALVTVLKNYYPDFNSK